MTALTIRLPNSLHECIKQLARKDGISVNQFIASAAAEKMAAFQTLDYLRREAEMGRREDFDQFMALVPDVPAQADDALPSSPKNEDDDQKAQPVPSNHSSSVPVQR